MNIIFFGNGGRGEKCLRTLIEKGKSIVAIVGHPNKSNLEAVAAQYEIPFLAPKKIAGEDFTETLKSYDPQLIILGGYNKIIKRNILDVPPLGVINLHGGKLPEYRGVAPINWQLINGETGGGFSILFVDEGIDTANVIRSTRFPIGPNDTANDLVARSFEWFPKNLFEVVEEFEQNGVVESEKQDDAKASHYTRRYPEDGEIEWERMTAADVHNLVRALTPPNYPGAFTFIDGEKILVLETELLEERFFGRAGRVQLKTPDGAIVIAADCGLLVKRVEFGAEELEARKALKIGTRLG